MRIKNLDCQVSSLLDDNGNWRQFSSAWPPIAINRGDPTAGARLWSAGDQLLLPVWQDPAQNPAGTHAEWSRIEAVWTPPAMPDGFQKAVRFSPSSLQPHTAQRPRCQFSLARVARPDDDAIAANPALGVPPNPPFTPIGEPLTAQPVTGFVNTERTYVDYFCLDPNFDTKLPNFIRATTITAAWHGSALGDLNTPPVQFNIRRGPTDDGPLHMTLTVAAGRSWPVSNGIPPWPYDSYVASGVEATGGLAYTEVRREFYLTDPDGPGITKAQWHKMVVRQFHHYAIGTGITEVWMDGEKMVGAGGRNIEIPDTKIKSRGPGDPGPADLGNYSHIPNMFLDNSGPQMQRLAVYCYVPNGGLNPKQPDIYHWQVWNNAIWHTGMGIWSDVADVHPTIPAQVFAPRPVETFSIFGEPTFERLGGSPVQEDSSLLGEVVTDRPRFRDLAGGEWRPVTTETS